MLLKVHVISLARLARVHAWTWSTGSFDTRTVQKVLADNARGHLNTRHLQTQDRHV